MHTRKVYSTRVSIGCKSEPPLSCGAAAAVAAPAGAPAYRPLPSAAPASGQNALIPAKTAPKPARASVPISANPFTGNRLCGRVSWVGGARVAQPAHRRHHTTFHTAGSRSVPWARQRLKSSRRRSRQSVMRPPTHTHTPHACTLGIQRTHTPHYQHLSVGGSRVGAVQGLLWSLLFCLTYTPDS